ncbi:MAG TPA: DUF167 domain-containing protein [Candidatus Bilamarchaeaceae archaeon]|nr:DUF167 domain-containing protein [Candidatus Bilamarchaeaceae archaeon]
MKYRVRVIPKAKRPEVMMQPDGSLRVKVDVPADKGKANRRLIEILAMHFDVSKRTISIMQGAKGREKMVEIG